jgi:hypothetical protein
MRPSRIESTQKVRGGLEPLDASVVHPDDYPIAAALLAAVASMVEVSDGEVSDSEPFLDLSGAQRLADLDRPQPNGQAQKRSKGGGGGGGGGGSGGGFALPWLQANVARFRAPDEVAAASAAGAPGLSLAHAPVCIPRWFHPILDRVAHAHAAVPSKAASTASSSLSQPPPPPPSLSTARAAVARVFGQLVASGVDPRQRLNQRISSGGTVAGSAGPSGRYLGAPLAPSLAASLAR